MRKQPASMSNPTNPANYQENFKIRLSSTKEIFENPKDYYEQRLRQWGYNEKLYYAEENNKIKNEKSRKLNILWFNPPYSKSMKTNNGKLFFC